MESEQSQNFNDRLSQWVANQGFWFQIRYSMSASGSKGTAGFHLLSLGFKLLVFLAVLAAGGWVFLAKRTATEGFGDTLKGDLKSALSASEIQLGGFNRGQGELAIKNLTATGGDQTFFTSLEAKNVRGKMGFLDGILGEWDLGALVISSLNIDLRAGADDADSAANFGNALFRSFEKVTLNNLEIADATLHWGYRKSISGSEDLNSSMGLSNRPTFSADHTRGAVENSLLKIQRTPDRMKLSFKGGTFTQNWLHRLDIVNLVVNCDRDGMIFENAEFKSGKGTVDFSGLKVTGGPRPQFDGTLKIRHLDVATIFSASQRSYLEGTISGDFKITGSTNEAQGIVFEGDVRLEDGDVLSLRNRLRLLRSLAMVDYSRNYKRVDFREGSFHLKTGGGGLEITAVNLIAGDLLSLTGNMKVRLPTANEAIATLTQSGPVGGTPVFSGEDADDEPKDSAADAGDFSLRRAALGAKREGEPPLGKPAKPAGNGSSQLERLDLSYEAQRVAEQSTQHLSRALRFEGLLQITLMPDAFERAPKLAADFPVDPRIGRIPLMVPLEGTIADLTLKMAEEIWDQARR